MPDENMGTIEVPKQDDNTVTIYYDDTVYQIDIDDLADAIAEDIADDVLAEIESEDSEESESGEYSSANRNVTPTYFLPPQQIVPYLTRSYYR